MILRQAQDEGGGGSRGWPHGGPADPMNLVWFAGGGGSSEGMAQAGYPADYALNHNQTALWMHEANHQGCRHLVDDAFAVHPLTLEPGRPIRLFWASPDCRHFSKALGGAPRSARIRGLCWSIIPWAKLRRPSIIILENVEEFTGAGPLLPDGKPDPARKGEHFRRFVKRLRQCGYDVEWRILVAADYGVPTIRKRLFLIARCDGQPITWPERTHAPRDKAAALGLKPWRAAAEILDFSIPCPSIFDRKRKLVAATDRRVAKGIERYVAGDRPPFLISITNRTFARDRADSAAEPIRTVTGSKGGEFALVAPLIAGTAHGDGRERAGLRAWSAEDPLRVVKSSNDAAVAAVSLQRQFGKSVGSAADEPVGAIMGGGSGKTALTAAYLGRQFGSTVSGRSLGEPAPSVMADGGGGKTQLIAASLVSYYETGVGSGCAEPLRVATAKARHGLTCAWLEQANTGMVGHDPRAPLSTIVGRGTTQRLCEVDLSDAPAPPSPHPEPVEGRGARRLQVLDFLQRHFGAPTPEDIADPLGSKIARLRFGLVLVEGAAYEIADIGLRMLTPRELFSAQGFPADYVIDRDPMGRPITKTMQTMMAGNSVCAPLARALVEANLGPPAAERLAA